MNDWFRRPPCGCVSRPIQHDRHDPPPHQADPCGTPLPRPPQPVGCYLMQRILASGRLHRRRQCYPLHLAELPCDARPPFTLLEVFVSAPPTWEEEPCRDRCGNMALRVTIPLSLRVRDGGGRVYRLSSCITESLSLSPCDGWDLCWRGQTFVQAAVRLAGRPCPGDGECSAPLEVLIEGYILSPCTMGRPSASACPPYRPWYPQPLIDRF